MTFQHFVDEIESVLAKWKAVPVVGTVVTDVEEAASATVSYIKANGLQDVYQIALMLVGAMVPGASWTGVLAAIEAQALTDGKQLVAGASAIVAAQAQADLLAAGKAAGLPTALGSVSNNPLYQPSPS